ncbi:MAG: efflux RND transporter permease subunit [Faecalibacterium sp.]
MEKFSVKKPFTVLVGVIMVLILGIVSLTSMAMDLLPSISVPMLIVITTYPGASAEKVEADVTEILESSLGTITGVTEVTSTSAENYSMVQLTFEDDTDMDTALVKVSSAVQNITAYLPDDCGVPSIMEISMDMLATSYVSLAYEGYDVYELSSFVSDTVTPTLERVDGVASITEVGLVEKTIYVELNQEKIDAVNADILAQVDEGLADAKQALDEADAEVQDAIAELEEAQTTFGEVLGDEIFAMLEDPLNSTVDSLQEQLADLSDDLSDAQIDLDSLGGSTDTDTSVDPDTAMVIAAYLLSTEEQEAFTLLAGENSSAETLGLTQDQTSAIASLLTAMGQTEAAAAYTALPDAVDTTAALVATDESVEELHTAIAAIEVSLIAAANNTLAETGASYTISTVADAFAVANATGAALEAAITAAAGAAVGDALTDLDAEALTGALENYNSSLASAQTTLWSLYAQMDALPDTVNTLVGIYASMTQIQLEAAVGFSTATVALSTAESELEAARVQYEAAEESALASANLDALLDVSTLAQLIYAQNFSMPAGYLDDADDNAWLLKVGQAYESAEELADALLLRMDGVGDITISDVADVVVLDNAEESYARLNGESAVILSIYKSSTAGTNDVSNGLNEAYEALEEKYPGLTFVTLMDQGDYINLIVDSVVSSMAVGAFLAIIILAFFLKDIMPTLVVGLSIPLSVLFAIVLMYFTGLSLNMMTLCGLALGIGMLVDNSIVVIENIYRLRGRGISAPRAAVQATRQVSGAIVASTLTTICVFLPLVFTSGTVRELMMPMGLCIAYCLFASLVVALTVVPATASTLLRNTKPKDHKFFDQVQEVYGTSLDFCLRVKAVPLAVSMGLLLLCIWQVFQMGIVVIPDIGSDEIEVAFSTSAELTREESYTIADEVLLAILEVDNVTDVGVMSSSDAASALGFSSGSGSYGSYTYYVTASENAGSGEIDQICADIEAVVAEMGQSASAASSGMGDLSSMTTSGLTITIEGDDLDTLAEVGETVAELVAQVDGYTNIYNGVGEGEATLQLDIDKDKAMEYGFTVVQIYMQIASYMTDEATSTTLTLDGETVTVVVQDLTSPLTAENLMDMEFELTSYTSDSSMDLSALSASEEEDEDEDEEEDDGIYLLSEFASLSETTTVASISRQNQSRYISVTASTLDGYNATLLAREMSTIIAQAEADGLFPEGYILSVGGESDEVNEMVSQMMLMVLLALAFIYLVMVAQFQSLLSPFIVLFTIPLAFTGGLIGLLIAGEQLSLISIMGFLVLMGTVVNNGIVFVDYTNQLRIGGMERKAALIATGKTRMRPILMTALTTILAMIQLMLGDDMASQMAGGMAIVIAGGLVYATLMTLYIIPVMYDIFFKRQPLNVDIGSEDLDDVPDDAAEFIAQTKALLVQQAGDEGAEEPEKD